MSKTEYAWLVETATKVAPLYLGNKGGRLGWVVGHEDAIRFSRKEDAESIKMVLAADFPRFMQGGERIVEHAWS